MRKILAALGAAPLLVTLLASPSQADPFGPRPEMVRDIAPGAGDSSPFGGAALGSRLVFWATTPRPGMEPWITDGTRAGTRLLRDVHVGPDGSTSEKGVEPMVAAGGRVFFVAYDPSHGDEVWVTDGTRQGTHLTRDTRPGGTTGLPRELVAAGGRVFFVSSDGVHGEELWVSDGTARGTRMVADIAPGATGSEISSVTAFDNGVVFSATQPGTGAKPWVSDGTTAGTYRIGVADPATGSSPASFAVLGSRVLFSARTGTSDVELWSASAAPDSARLVRDIQPGPEASAPTQLTRFGARVTFTADDGTTGAELWISDGTSAGTHLVRDIAPGDDSAYTDFPTVHKGWLYFTASDPGHGEELWRTRGTPASTQLVKDIHPGPPSSDPESLVSVGGRLVFSAETPAHGEEPWVTDGTAASTALVRDLYAGLASSYGYPVGVIGGTVVLIAVSPAGSEPWVWTVRTSTTRPSPKHDYPLRQARRKQVRVLVRVRTPGVSVTGGRVVLRRQGTVLGSARVVHGRAKVRIRKRLGVGRHRLLATYLGSVQAQSSRSRSVVVIEKG